MGVIETNEWLSREFDQPEKNIERIKEDPEDFYSYLQQFGMYKPNLRTWEYFKQLKEENIWKKVENLHNEYRKKWNGVDIEIYIFPSRSNNKGGVSFKESMYLFVPPLEDLKELEALFIHEYHHVCRLNRQKKNEKDYKLLDSMVLEGLAEHAVEYYCGTEYRAKWCEYYTEKELGSYWNKLKGDILQTNRKDNLHDRILFGRGGYPKLLGYALGYYLTRRNNFENNNFSRKINFYSTPEYFINSNKNSRNPMD
ncbi:DUF2268 domain-containing protein [Robertmurraya kyonggiensis]|uniref:DUF2268 domain-containing protein n=1 Tax=Robertmurraya kyonggiensis TaxID=1037680 RepID=A0A4U1DA15_9BACI|nr:DUF2268 domain-containing putative Zn-dependent protease [Robertmurraya kyonggiensis]TKC18276.1 hypothetical protein FA727_01595 [Robertmurraya kyonggiensis]